MKTIIITTMMIFMMVITLLIRIRVLSIIIIIKAMRFKPTIRNNNDIQKLKLLDPN